MKISRSICMICCAILLAAPAWAQGVLFVEGNNVGIGTATPAFLLDIQGTNSRVEVVNTSGSQAARTLFKVSNNGFPRFVLEDRSNSATWLMASASGGSFTFSKVGSGVNEFVVEPGGNLTVAGSATATAFNTSSSRLLKEDILEVDGQEILSRLVALPVSEWTFRADGTGTRHLGPMAEDFQEAFGLGTDSRHIGLMDATGVTMAALKGLYEVVAEKDVRISELEAMNAHLAAQNAAFEKRLQALEKMSTQIDSEDSE